MRADGAGDPRSRREETTVKTRQSLIRCQEKGDQITLELDMPEAEAAAIDVALKGRRLTVAYEKSGEERTEEGGEVRVVKTYESLKKEIDLPADVEASSADAVLKDGVLFVTLTKKAGDAAGGTRVEVKTS